jgi:hypothetical protein
VKHTININLDSLLEKHGALAIVGPGREDEEGTAWVLYLPDETPCICDSFKDAAGAMNEYLRRVGASATG